MTLRISSVSMRNFLSVGNAPQSVKLNKDGLTLVLGENLDTGGVNSRNGVGKSTLLQAVSFGLFGLPLSNIKKDNLVNSINAKNMAVTVDFDIDGKHYKIERGRKPQFIRYYVNDGLVNDEGTDESQGDSRNTQLEIEKALGFSHDMFRHIVAMNTYTDPFLKMKPGDQRALIEELLGITALSTRSDILKEMVKETKDAIKGEEYRIKAVQDSNIKIQNTINDLKLKHNSWDLSRRTRIENAQSNLAGLQTLDIESEIQAHHNLVDFRTLSNEINRTRQAQRKIDQELNSRTSMYERTLTHLASAQDHKCHACGGELHDSNHDTMIKELEKQVVALEQEIVEISMESDTNTEMLNELTAGLNAIGEEPFTVYSTLQQALGHKNTIDNLLAEIKREQESVNPYTDQIEHLQDSGLQEVNHETVNELNTLLKHQDFLLKLLTSKDSFIRKKIIDQNINHLNHRLNFYLEKLNLPHEVQFKSDLSVEINLLGRDYDFEQLSRGEMNRVILSTSWAFRDVWESLNQPVNLMFVDEMIDNGLDQQGAEHALDLMKRMARERGKNIFLISHKDELVARVNKILMVKKENSFTRFDTDAGENE